MEQPRRDRLSSLITYYDTMDTLNSALLSRCETQGTDNDLSALSERSEAEWKANIARCGAVYFAARDRGAAVIVFNAYSEEKKTTCRAKSFRRRLRQNQRRRVHTFLPDETKTTEAF
jgi:hypothetical protein